MESLIAQIAKEGSLVVVVLTMVVLLLCGAIAVMFAGWRQDVKDRRDNMAGSLDRLTEVITALRLDLAKGDRT